jgi:hypothetical protein
MRAAMAALATLFVGAAGLRSSALSSARRWTSRGAHAQLARRRGLRAVAMSSEPAEPSAAPVDVETPVHSEFLRIMQSRGYLYQCSNLKELDALMCSEVVPAYLGFDATASSLHVGSLLQIMILRHLQKSGHKPVVLVGGGTTKIGDPSGRDTTRMMLTDEKIDENIAGISKVRCLARVGTAGGRPPAPHSSRLSRLSRAAAARLLRPLPLAERRAYVLPQCSSAAITDRAAHPLRRPLTRCAPSPVPPVARVSPARPCPFPLTRPPPLFAAGWAGVRSLPQVRRRSNRRGAREQRRVARPALHPPLPT